MAVSLTLRGGFALLLALSVGMKIDAGNQSRYGAERAMEDAAMDGLVAFLDRHGFRVGEAEGEPDFQFVRASAGDCHLLATLMAPQGWHRDVIRQLASPRDQVFVVFNAVVYQNQPTRLTWTYHYWRALNHYIGHRIPVRPVLGIIASPACDLRGMPWREFAELS